MGGVVTKRNKVDFSDEVCFDHFKLLRSVGKGAFGKVCIVKKRDTRALYAMKYMSKQKCIEEKAVDNVYNERKILMMLNHPLIVNLWFAFQDKEDMFMVVDLMLGGDLRYHLQKSGAFSEARVKGYMAELSMGLEYVHSHNIIHRDIKPDNILLDIYGHAHLADFNVATFEPTKGKLNSRAGTRHYMAPEMVTKVGYGRGVDWWSLGVTMFEMLVNKNPFYVRGSTTEEIAMHISSMEIHWPTNLSDVTIIFLQGLLERDPEQRLGTPNHMVQLQNHPYFANLGCSWEEVVEKKLQPEFIPDKDKVHCDAMYELEEMMLEENPLHKKKQRLRSMHNQKDIPIEPGSLADELRKIDLHYKVFNREKLQEAEKPSAPTNASDDDSRRVSGASTSKESLGSHIREDSEDLWQQSESIAEKGEGMDSMPAVVPT